ncbi:MAG: SUMF1/EgtB/PvdO family nonheme iron enzyme [Polyangiaceae bacterium]
MKLAAVGLALACAGCGSQEPEQRAQWVVTLTTDAPLPQFGDRVLIDVLDASGAQACADRPLIEGSVACRRQVAAIEPALWPISFGIAEPDTPRPLRVRVRLYRAASAGEQGLPTGRALVDRVARLPAADGVTRVWLDLPMACFGVSTDVAAATTCDPASGELAPEREMPRLPASLPEPGTWPPAARVPCPTSVSDDMRCVEGGVFLLGALVEVELFKGLRPSPERLVRLSPFAIDVAEVTVKQVRDLALKGELTGMPTPTSPDPKADAHACFFPQNIDDDSQDGMPVNCLTRDLAREICGKQGKRLPTEAEWEYVASNMDRESAFPWGESLDICSRAVVGRGRTDIAGPRGAAQGEDPSCRVAADGPVLPWGPVAGGSDADVTSLGVKNLAGNVSEYVDGDLIPYGEDCWSGIGMFQDPLCESSTPIVELQHTIRGGAWSSTGFLARAWSRSAANPSPSVGFRCARSF